MKLVRPNLTAASVSGLCMLVLSLFLSGCATPVTPSAELDNARIQKDIFEQRRLYVQNQDQDLTRLKRIAWPLFHHNAALCNNLQKSGVWGYGFSAGYIDQFESDFRDAVFKYYKMAENHPTVTLVTPGGPADKAGMKKGDHIIAFQGENISVRRSEIDRFFDTLIEHRARKDKLPISMVVKRGQKHIKIKLRPERTCDYAIRVIPETTINAYVDNHQIVFTRALLNKADDEMIRVLMAHQLGHILMGHTQSAEKKQSGSRLFGMLLDMFSTSQGVETGGYWSDVGAHTRGQVYPESYETEADYMAFYLLARAGYDLSQVKNIWQMFSTEPGESQTLAPDFTCSHFSVPERFIAMDKMIAEIERKKRMDQPLVPDTASGQSIKDRFKKEAQPDSTEN